MRLGTQVVDEVRRRVQKDTLHRHGHRDDPLCKIRGLLRHGAEHLTERQLAKLNTCLAAGNPDWEVSVAWRCYQQLRQAYAASPTAPTTSTTTDYASCSSPTDQGPTGTGRTALNDEEPDDDVGSGKAARSHALLASGAGTGVAVG